MSKPSANHAQITQFATLTGPNPPAAKSPLESEYKAMLKRKVLEVETLLEEKEDILTENVVLKSGLDSRDMKISAQQQRIDELTSMLKMEKKKSRAVIAKLMTDADSIIAEANNIKAATEAQAVATSKSLDKSKQKYKDVLQKERQFHFSVVSSCKFNVLPNHVYLCYT